VDGFERDLEKFLGVEQGTIVALSSGTAALHLALVQLGVELGDEVICQSFTFSASANPIKYVGAKPVFVDSESDTWNMDPDLLEIAIKDRMKNTGKKPKAIIRCIFTVCRQDPMRLWKLPPGMKSLFEMPQNHWVHSIKASIAVLLDILHVFHLMG
jgi:hypothetical protein